MARMEQPLISVLVAAYNCEEWVVSAVESVLAEREVPLEVVVVDDASTDSTPQVLDWLARRDERVKVVHRAVNGGEGPCRASGMEVVSGAWLVLLDADDLCMPGALRRLAACLEETDADVVLTSHYRYDVPTKIARKITWTKVGRSMPKGSFDPVEDADTLFSKMGSSIANKVFRMEHVRSQHVFFQQIERIGDVHFTLGAIACARRVEYVDIPFYRYRMNYGTSLTNTGVRYPLSFAKACYGLQDFLEGHGIWDTWQHGFLNWVVANVPYNLSMMGSLEALRTLAGELHDTGFERMGFDTLDPSACVHPKRHEVCLALRDGGVDEALFALMKLNRSDADARLISLEKAKAETRTAKARTKQRDRQLDEARAREEELRGELSKVWGSQSMRVGRVATFVPRKARDFVYRVRHGGAAPQTEAAASAPEAHERVAQGPAPLVTVAVAATGESKNVRSCLASIAAQDFSDFEVIVLCADSDTAAASVTREFCAKDERFCDVVRWDPGEGAFEVALRNARGSWLTCVRSDDYLYPECLGALVGVAVGTWAKLVMSGQSTFAKTPAARTAVLAERTIVSESDAGDAADEDDPTLAAYDPAEPWGKMVDVALASAQGGDDSSAPGYGRHLIGAVERIAALPRCYYARRDTN